MRKIAFLLVLALVLSGCAGFGGPQQYSVTYFTLFDTVTVISGYADSQKKFDAAAEALHDELLEYHRLFDVYKDYKGINNLKTVNDNAGVAPVVVDSRIIELLLDCREYYALTDGRVNVAMGSVLRLWHDARNAGLDDPEHAALPDTAALEAAGKHTSWDTVVIDAEASTVFITDPNQLLDVGAVAKGWSVQRVAENAPAGMLLNVGGNVCATGPKPEEQPWVVGVSDPSGELDYLLTLDLRKGSLVTSGDYQRFYTVDGVNYHHIIDPDTLMPARYWSSVTILCGDSGLADALSTALFLLPLEEGKALLKKSGAEAMWIDAEGNCYYSDGFEKNIHQ